MSRPGLRLLVRPALGPVPHPDARARLQACQNSIELRYEWVKDWAAFDVVVNTPGVRLSDGAEWVTLIND